MPKRSSGPGWSEPLLRSASTYQRDAFLAVLFFAAGLRAAGLRASFFAAVVFLAADVRAVPRRLAAVFLAAVVFAAFLAAVLRTVFFAAVVFAAFLAAVLRAVFLAAVDFDAAREPAREAAVVFFAADFFAAGLRAVVFLAAGFFAAVVFFAAVLRAVVFFAADFFAGFAADFLVAAFLAAGFVAGTQTSSTVEDPMSSFMMMSVYAHACSSNTPHVVLKKTATSTAFSQCQVRVLLHVKVVAAKTLASQGFSLLLLLRLTASRSTAAAQRRPRLGQNSMHESVRAAR